MRVKKDGYGLNINEVEFWKNHRSKLNDLYNSERHFFTPTIQAVNSVIDLGCAAGGSALFSREANDSIRYTGIDISSELIDASKIRFKDSKNTEFIHFDGETIPLKDNHSEFCFSFGVFHHLNHWKEMIDEAMRVSSKYTLFDLRVWENQTICDNENSYQKLALSGDWDNESVIPYNVISFNELISHLKSLCKEGISCSAYGYYAAPTALAITPAEKVLMLSVLFNKCSDKSELEIKII